MKKLVLLFIFLGSTCFSAIAQTTRAKVNNQRQDSLPFAQKPKPVNTVQPTKAKVKQAPNNGNIKLDDLRNPFDTNKVKTTKALRSKN